MKNILFKTFVLMGMVFTLSACGNGKGHINSDGTFTYWGDSSGNQSGTSSNNSGNGSSSNGDPSKAERRASYDKDVQTLKDNGYTTYNYLYTSDLHVIEEGNGIEKGTLYAYVTTYKTNKFDIFYFFTKAQASSYYNSKKDEYKLTLHGWKVIMGETDVSEIISFIE